MARVALMDAQIALYTYAKSTSTKLMPVPTFEFVCDGLRDPMARPDLRMLSGSHPAVQEYLREDPRVLAIIHASRMLADEYVKVNKGGWLSLGYRDYHERWISRGVAELVANALSPDFKVTVVIGTTV